MHSIKSMMVATATLLALANVAQAETRTWKVNATTVSAVPAGKRGVPDEVKPGASYQFTFIGDSAAGFDYVPSQAGFSFANGRSYSAELTNFYTGGKANMTLITTGADHFSSPIDTLFLSYSVGASPANLAEGFAGLAAAVGNPSQSSLAFYFNEARITARITAVTVVPEPATYALLAAGLLVVAAIGRRRA